MPDDLQTGLKSQLQNSHCTWAQALYDDTVNKNFDIADHLVDDPDYGIMIFCNPNSIVQQLLNPDKADNEEFYLSRRPLYANEVELVGTQEAARLLNIFTRFNAMCQTLNIQTGFTKTKYDQTRWIKAAIQTYPVETLLEALQHAHSKLILLIEWMAFSENMTIDA